MCRPMVYCSGSSNNSYNILFETESELAKFYKSEEAVLFKSGFDANIAFFEIIASPNDYIIIDELCHSSIITGCRLSRCKNIFTFKHSKVNDLERILIEIRNNGNMDSNNIIVGIESIYSMDGDIAPIPKINELCMKYNCHLYIDEAHAVGIYGKNGVDGITSLYDNNNNINIIRLITFSKSYSCSGAAILCTKIIKKYLINYAKSLIYTHVITPFCLLSIKRNHKYIISSVGNKRREKLNEIIKYFKKQIKLILNINPKSNTHIQYIPINDSLKSRDLQRYLINNQIAAGAISYPIVPKGQSRIRVLLHAHNTKKQIKTFLFVVKTYLYSNNSISNKSKL